MLSSSSWMYSQSRASGLFITLLRMRSNIDRTVSSLSCSATAARTKVAISGVQTLLIWTPWTASARKRGAPRSGKREKCCALSVDCERSALRGRLTSRHSRSRSNISALRAKNSALHRSYQSPGFNIQEGTGSPTGGMGGGDRVSLHSCGASHVSAVWTLRRAAVPAILAASSAFWLSS